MKRLFGAAPSDSGIAFIVVPHLAPAHESLMAELLAKQTDMPVAEAREGAAVEANHVYVIPPNKYLSIRRGRLRLTGPVSKQVWQTPIDLFLRSLAEDQRERAIGIVLSGTGSHGTVGLKAVKENGGMTIVQDPTTADYGQMPQSAIDAEVADFVLPPAKMPEALAQYVRHPYVRTADTALASGDAWNALNEIVSLLRTKTRHYFGCYRRKMLRRRIERRMSLNHIERLGDYLELLQTRPDEVRRLSKDLLISVTSFFREPDSFRVLETKVIRDLVRRIPGDSPIRVWVPGCATGEEAYSIAILFLEKLSAASKNCPLQVFASDADDAALEIGRQGVYPDGITADVSAKRLSRFFTRTADQCYRVNKQLRDSVVFARQNLIGDAPFSKLDLISCRNLLIYLEPDVQKKVISLLHFALNERGYLFLGPAESIGRQGDLFDAISAKWRIYRHVRRGRAHAVDFPIVSGIAQRIETRRGTEISASHSASVSQQLTQHLLLQDFAPAAVLIGRASEILYFHGPTMRYLDQPSGEPTRDLMAMAPDGIRSKLRAAVRKALRDKSRVTVSATWLGRRGNGRRVRLTARPIHAPRVGTGLVLVTFEDEQAPATKRNVAVELSEPSLVHHLEDELRITREDLRNTVGELQAANEDLKSSNEEIVSMNEELQSANEELETSKEELQSLNEELSTVNSQLQDKVGELEKSNNDLANLLTSADIATVFLDTHLRIRRFTSAATKLLSLIATDVGRPLSDISLKFDDDQLFADLDRVMRDATPRQKEVSTNGGRYCLRRILPYRTTEGLIEGVVITFTDISEAKLADEHMKRLATVLMDSNDAVTVQDFDGRILAWNRGAERMYGYSQAEAMKMNASKLVPEALRPDTEATTERLRQGERVNSWETQRTRKDGSIVQVWITATPLKDAEGHPFAVATTEQDVTQRRALEREILEVTVREQRRVGQDLHDVTGQELTGLRLLAHDLAESLTERALPDAETARKIAEGLKQALSHVRTLSRGLNPVEVDAQGLMAALEDLAARTSDLYRIPCTFRCQHPVTFANNGTATHLYRIAQEAITNAVKHAQARRVQITLMKDASAVRLEVQDDGVGIRKRPPSEPGTGLRIMAHRADVVGAKLNVGPGPTGGTLVSCTLPKGR
ncbi:MAG: PAS domain-containing protein [Planctomycetes bacterium]|nr:PAS domain-containing protein [Planctomycetota bacterium]